MDRQEQFDNIRRNAGLTHERRKDFERKRDELKANGYRVGFAETLLADTLQPRFSEYSGIWAIDDPNDDDEGFCLRGDDLFALVDEAHAARITWED